MWVALGLSVICALLVFPGVRRSRKTARPLLKKTGPHWRRNYSRRSLLRLLGGTTVAGLLAYSGVDRLLDDLVSSRFRNRNTDRLASGLRLGGERFWFANWLVVAAIDAWWRSGSFSRWGRGNFEAMVVGLPVLWTMQRGLGANRPSSKNGDPRWRPLAAANSASGHTFMAAVPWLNLARRNTPRVWGRLAYVGSVLTGWSRINDRKHYLSQVVLGWTIAWNAVDAVQVGDLAEPDKYTLQRNDDETE